MTAEERKYIVADGVSFVGNKKSYKPGDEIDKTVFKDEKRFNDLVTKKRIVEVTAKTEKTDTDNDPEVQTNLSREELEKLAHEFMPLEAIQRLDDKKLAKILKKKEKI